MHSDTRRTMAASQKTLTILDFAHGIFASISRWESLDCLGIIPLIRMALPTSNRSPSNRCNRRAGWRNSIGALSETDRGSQRRR